MQPSLGHIAREKEAENFLEHVRQRERPPQYLVATAQKLDHADRHVIDNAYRQFIAIRNND